MTQTIIFTTILLTGLGCGLGCGSISTPFLVTRMIGENKSTRACIQVVALFVAGKIIMLALLGLLSAFLGGTVLSAVQTLYPNVTKWVFRVLIICFAAYIIYNTLRSHDCSHCKGCGSDKKERLLTLSYPLAGAVYAAIPCAPLVLALTYAAAMKPAIAVLLLVCFGLANSLFPILLYAPITGAVMTKMRAEIPQFMKYIQLVAGGVLLVLAVFV